MHLPARKRNENTKMKNQLGQDDIPKLASLPGEREENVVREIVF
jgi:hypothetical protein